MPASRISIDVPLRGRSPRRVPPFARPPRAKDLAPGPRRRVAGIGLVVLAPILAFAAAGCATGGAAPPASSAVAGWEGGPIVRTASGLVGGQADSDGTWLWKAIPYAAPPVGRLRWRAPQAPAPWSGVRRERHFNGGCLQYSELGAPGRILGSEDCLYLNVWRPRDAERKLPVYFWIHGGADSSGSSVELSTYRGNRVASRSRFVFVSINYRLGPFGWFTCPALRDGASADDASGDYGTLDIIMALRWVHDNIAAFGGDPGRVTVAGESAGGENVLSLLLAPAAAGLFQAAVIESGLPSTDSVAAADRTSAKVLRTLLRRDGHGAGEADRLAGAMSASEIRSYLRSKSGLAILRCYTPDRLAMIDNPVVLLDGHVLPSAGYALLARGAYPNKVPIIMGSNRDEARTVLYELRVPWRSAFYAAAATWGSRLWKAAAVDDVARELCSAPGHAPVWVYEFDWGTPGRNGSSPLWWNFGRRLGSFHGLELPFFLGHDSLDGFPSNFLFNPAYAKGRRALSADMMAYAADLARSGDPNAGLPAGLPEWRAWSNRPGTPEYLVFNAGRSSADIAMADGVRSASEVMADLDRSLAEPLRSRILSFFAQVESRERQLSFLGVGQSPLPVTERASRGTPPGRPEQSGSSVSAP